MTETTSQCDIGELSWGLKNWVNLSIFSFCFIRETEERYVGRNIKKSVYLDLISKRNIKYLKTDEIEGMLVI